MLHMEQNLTFEVIEVLLRQPLHAREVASRLKINHMTVLRRIRELVSDNVLDVRSEGRNKVYIIKKTVEARNTVLMAELYKLTKLVNNYPDLRRIVQQIQQNGRVKLAILFGSYAKGDAKKTSDIDIFIETQSRKLRDEIGRIDSKLSVKVGPYDRESTLIKEIEKDHVIIKGAEDFFAKTRYFG